jgi:dihydroflavonol-4-reductase
MPASVNSGFDWVDVRDVAEGAVAAERLAAPGSHYILGGQWVSVRDMALLVEEISGVRPPWFNCPMWLALPAARVFSAFTRHSGQPQVFTDVSLMALRSSRHISHERATRELGYHPRRLRDSIVDTVAWWQARVPASRPR